MAVVPECLLIDQDVAHLVSLSVEQDPPSFSLVMSATPLSAICPLCSQSSCRVHSTYTRTLADVSWACVPVRIHLRVRRFFCDTPSCPRRIFTERRPTVMQPYARRTTRLSTLQQQIGLALGGSAGATVCTLLGIPGGVDMMLDGLRQLPAVVHPTPRVLGVDDWAIRKGQRYGTILIDHERGHVVDLLPDRTTASVRDWLREHPGVEIVTRDRDEGYGQAITEGAPDALQVADRWHLLKNVTDALAVVLHAHRTTITEHIRHGAPQTSAETAGDGQQRTNDVPIRKREQATPADKRRQERAEQAHTLHAQGWSQKTIAAHLACHPKTVGRWLKRTLPLPARGTTRPSALDPYRSYLTERWNQGCHNASQLFREIGARGFRGGCTIVRMLVAQLRVESGMPERSRNAPGRTIAPSVVQRIPSSRYLAWLCTKPPSEKEVEKHMCVQLRSADEPVASAVQLASEFATLLRAKNVEQFEAWLERASASGIKSFQSVAQGMRADREAIHAALTTPWSNGRTEGFVNRLKCLKRMMYGRGKLDLLRLRLMLVMM